MKSQVHPEGSSQADPPMSSDNTEGQGSQPTESSQARRRVVVQDPAPDNDSSPRRLRPEPTKDRFSVSSAPFTKESGVQRDNFELAPTISKAKQALDEVPSRPPATFSLADYHRMGLGAADEGDLKRQELEGEPEEYINMCSALPRQSVYYFSLKHPVRKWAIRTMYSKWFSNAVLLLILTNSIFLAMTSQEPDFERTDVGKVVNIAEYIFTSGFAVEMVIKIIAMSFVVEEGSYLRDAWNVIDFVVVVLGMLAFVPSFGNYTAIRVVRVFRPLRTITTVPGMRVLVQTLIKSLPMLLDVGILCAFVFAILGIVGIQTFVGTFRMRCTEPSFDPQTGGVVYSVPDSLEEVCTGRLASGTTWDTSGGALTLRTSVGAKGTGNVCRGPDDEFPDGLYCSNIEENPNFGLTSFDNIAAAWLTIFQCITMEGWTDVMYIAQDAVSGWVWVYFVFMILFGSFFMVNLALAVLYMYFTKESDDVPAEEEDEGEKEPEPEQADEPPDAMIAEVGARGPPWWAATRVFCLKVSYWKYFDVTTNALIILNTLVMAAEHYRMPDWQAEGSDYVNYILTGYFFLEMSIKLTGLGVKRYFRVKMNAFDAFVVVMSILEIIISLSAGSEGSNLSVLRAFRIMRMFKLARSWRDLQKLIETMSRSVTSVSYLSLILSICIFIFALLGMQIFGYKFTDCEADGALPRCPLGMTTGGNFAENCPRHRFCYVECAAEQVGTFVDAPGSAYNGRAYCEAFTDGVSTEYLAQTGDAEVARHNFDNIYWSVLTIFQILTGENWNEVMYDGMRKVGWYAAFYFVLLVVVGNYIILNLFLAILLDNFSGYAEEQEEDEQAALRKGLEGGSGKRRASTSTADAKSSALQAPRAEKQRRASSGASSATTGAAASMHGARESLNGGNARARQGERSAAGSVAGDGGSPSPGPAPLSKQITKKPSILDGLANPAMVRASSIRVGELGRNASHKGSFFSGTKKGRGESEVPPESKANGGRAAGEPADPDAVLSMSGGRGRQPDLKAPSAAEAGAAPASGEPISDEDQVAMAFKHSALWIFPGTSRIRQAMAALVKDKRFEYTIIVLIVMSSLLLAIDEPGLDPKSDFKKALDTLDLIFVILFAIEAAIKTVVLGFALHPCAYLRSPFNVLDFFIVVVGILLLFLDESGGLSSLRALRTVRALRPIRMASRAEGMKVVVGALFGCIPAMGNVLLVCLLFFLIFGIMGVNFFKGAFFRCIDVATGDKLESHVVRPFGVKIDRAWCESPQPVNITTSWYHDQLGLPFEPYTIETFWTEPPQNFNNIGSAILTLFEIASLELWLDVMYNGIDSRGEDKAIQRDASPWYALFFIFFVVVGAFFILNLFVGVTIDKFNEMKKKAAGKSVFLTEEQSKWLTVQKLLALIKPQRKQQRPKSNYLRQVSFDIVTHDRFDPAIILVILLNVLFMATEHYKMADPWETTLNVLNITFTAIYVVEAALKIMAFYPKKYFSDSWNLFDFIVALLSVVGIIVDNAAEQDIPVVSLLRVFRVARILRLIPKARGLRMLFRTLMYSLPALWNVGSVVFLFFFIFAIMGMQLFGLIPYNEDLSRHANFKNFPNAMLTLFRMATGESWNGIMWDTIEPAGQPSSVAPCYRLIRDIQGLGREDEYVTAEAMFQYEQSTGTDLEMAEDFWEGCGPGRAVSILYFVIFSILCAFVMLNLVIAIILDNYQISSQDEDLPVTGTDMQIFADMWAVHDPAGTMYIDANKLPAIISQLEPPLGTKGLDISPAELQQMLMRVSIPNRGGKVHFHETLYALSSLVAYADVPQQAQQTVSSQLRGTMPKDESKYSVAHYHAALYVQAAVRGFLARYEMQNRLDRRDPEQLGQGAPNHPDRPSQE
ncbi:unnamed protein product [Pedinophyceae sp. YPF-701]|nr:unnamed protein product [Pedinophyceae sp. YPF-701]